MAEVMEPEGGEAMEVVESEYKQVPVDVNGRVLSNAEWDLNYTPSAVYLMDDAGTPSTSAHVEHLRRDCEVVFEGCESYW